MWKATDSGAQTVQRTRYYPSGLPWEYQAGDSASLQPYKYGGKEFVEMHGLDMYDSHARWYDPLTFRTPTPDPLAEKYYSISPYAWCGNNPVNNVDPTGMDWYEDENEVLTWTDYTSQEELDKHEIKGTYLGQTGRGVNSDGIAVYGTEDGKVYDSTLLFEIDVNGKMSDHLRDMQAAADLGIYQAHREFLSHPITEATIGILSSLIAPGFFATETLTSTATAVKAATEGVRYSDDLVKAAQKIYPKKR